MPSAPDAPHSPLPSTTASDTVARTVVAPAAPIAKVGPDGYAAVPMPN